VRRNRQNLSSLSHRFAFEPLSPTGSYGQRAEIRVEEAPDQLILRVCDHGPGMPASEIEKVIQPFYRLEGSRSRETGGTGLGLPIARNIAQAHGGDVNLRNCEGGWRRP
jgi:signal transduction histidine kinase